MHAYITLAIVVSVTNEAVSDGRASAASGDISIKVGSVAESGSQFGGSRDGQFSDVFFNINECFNLWVILGDVNVSTLFYKPLANFLLKIFNVI